MLDLRKSDVKGSRKHLLMMGSGNRVDTERMGGRNSVQTTALEGFLWLGEFVSSLWEQRVESFIEIEDV